MRWIVWGTLPLGGLLGGVFSSVLGIRATIWVGVVGGWASALWVLFSPLRTMRDVGESQEAEEADRAGSGSAFSHAQDREQDQNDRGDGEDAVGDDNRDGEVPLGRNS